MAEFASRAKRAPGSAVLGIVCSSLFLVAQSASSTPVGTTPPPTTTVVPVASGSAPLPDLAPPSLDEPLAAPDGPPTSPTSLANDPPATADTPAVRLDEPPPASPPVIPGLIGFGTDTPAGRGGQILVVNSLADAGPGTLRAAIETPGARIIVFEVGGTIQLESPLIAREPFFTLAGQTAPDPGITLASYHFSIRTHDVLVQHIRVRAGDVNGGDPEGISIYQPGGLEVHSVVIDHTSTSWAIDENTNTWSATAGDDGPHAGVHDVTFSNNLIAEALDDSTHDKGPHSKGMLVGDGSERIAVLRNVFVNNADRNPEMTGGTSAVVANNLIYGWDPRQQATHFGRAGTVAAEPTCASVVANVYLRSALMRSTPASAVEIHRDLPPGSRIFLAGNLSPTIIPLQNDAPFDPLVEMPPVWPINLAVVPAFSLTEPLLGSVGARPAARDAVDLRVIADVYAGTGRIIDSQDQVGGWPVLESTERRLDLPADPHADDDLDGYTNVEEWLQEYSNLVQGSSVSITSSAGATTLPSYLDPQCS